MKFLALSTLLFIVACTKEPKTPEVALKEFVDSSIGQVVDRDAVQKKITGPLLRDFKAMSEAEFKEFADMKDVKTDSFKIVSKECEKEECVLKYSIGFTTSTYQKPTFVSEVEKMAHVVQVEGEWLISEVKNVSTSHVNLEPLEPIKK